MGDRQNQIKGKIKQILKIEDPSAYVDKILDEKSHFFCLNVARLWRDCSRNSKLFKTKHCDWLKSNLSIQSGVNKSTKNLGLESQPEGSRGRPKVNFEEASKKTKIRRVEGLVSDHTPEELCFAAERSLKLNKVPQQEIERKNTKSAKNFSTVLRFKLICQKVQCITICC